MPSTTKWTIWSRFYVGAFLLYGGLLWFVSMSVFLAAIKHGARLKPPDIVIQSLMTLFLPILILGIWKQRLASGLLFAGAATDLALTLFLNAHTGNGMGGLLNASLLFLGFPMLASALIFHLLSRTTSR